MGLHVIEMRSGDSVLRPISIVRSLQKCRGGMPFQLLFTGWLLRVYLLWIRSARLSSWRLIRKLTAAGECAETPDWRVCVLGNGVPLCFTAFCPVHRRGQ